MIENKNDLESKKDTKRWHAMSNDEIYAELKVDPKVGLTSQEAARRLEKEGKNKLEEAKQTSHVVIFFKTFLDPLAIIMMFAGLLSLFLPIILGEVKRLAEPTNIAGICVIFGVVLANSIISTIQEIKASKSLNALQSMAEPKTIVLRDGKQMEVCVEDIVRGDIVYIETGKFIPADIRIIESPKLRVDESALTGESLPVEKTTNQLLDKDMVLGDQINLGFMSTFITDGRAVGVVFATGTYSAVGQIASSIANTEQKKTPLQKKLGQLTLWVSILAAISGALIFTLMYTIGNFGGDISSNEKLIDSLIFSISAGVALIPESIMIIVTITLSLSARKMANRNVVVKSFAAVETLGAVNVICSDKTGTLTQNKMTIMKLLMNGEIIEQREYRYDPKNQQSFHFINSLVLCSDSISQDGVHIGDPTELALTDWTQLLKVNELKFREKYPRLDEIPFNSDKKLMTTVNQVDNKRIVYTKGALDRLLARCTKTYVDGKLVVLTEKMKQEILESSYPLLGDALRVLGFAYNEQNKTAKEFDNDLIFLGCVAMMDPPRPEAATAIKRAHDSGIRVIMITGDHKLTALEIAKRIGISSNEFPNGLTGEEIDKLDDEQFDEHLLTTNVFARVNPDHKTRIVEALQRQGKIVAMTGDGVNDSPSLAKADVGIAMGITGTDVAKEAAKVILADDNFATIISGVREGRNVYEKIKRSIAFLLGANLAQMLTILVVLAISHGKALNDINVLWHILAVETVLAIPIGLAHSKETLMAFRPRNPHESVFKWITIEILSMAFFNAVTAIGAYFIGYYGLGSQASEAQKLDTASTMAYIVIIFAPILYSWISQTRNYTVKFSKDKAEKIRINEWMLIAMIGATLINLGTLFIPGLSTLFKGENDQTKSWMYGAAFGLVLLTFLLKWLENWSFRKIYQYLHSNEIMISKFNFRKKQIRDDKRKKKIKIKRKISKLKSKMNN
ncbi:cation-translocating P-type ATPase [[Acholeplasma] multilocale]|uniref:cation-translocating P-type ATPase n=1 Tax=[Acholeplasma] multilocale TaxID=264638 RepID=UPI0006841D44|nr:cation-translocating P-type ATPase [[Acholeplasma] multilocale]